MATIMIPTLHISAPLLDDPNDMIIHVIRHATSIPSGVTNTYRGYEISIQKRQAEVGYDSGLMASAVQHDFETVYERLFPDAQVLVFCTPVDIGDNMYDLSLDVTIVIGEERYTASEKISISSSGQIELNTKAG